MRILIAGQPGLGARLIGELLVRLLEVDSPLGQDSEATIAPDIACATWIEATPDQSAIAWTSAPPTPKLLSIVMSNSPWRVLVPYRLPEHALKAAHVYSNTVTPPPSANHAYSNLVGCRLDDDSLTRFATTYLQHSYQVAQDWLDTSLAARIRIEAFYSEPRRALCELADTLGLTLRQDRLLRCITYLTRLRTGLATDDLRSLGPDRPVGIPSSKRQTMARHLGCGGYDHLRAPSLQSGRHPRDPDERLTEFHSFLGRHSDSKRLFVIGFGKSGTTWLARMFGAHPECNQIGERKLIESAGRSPSLLKPLLSDEFFLHWFEQSTFGLNHPEDENVRYELARVQSDYLLYRSFQRRPWGPDLSDELVASHLVEKIALTQKNDAFSVVTALPRMYPTAKFIHIVRDPRDVVVSAMFHRYRNLVKAGTSNFLTRYLDRCRTIGHPPPPDDDDALSVASVASDIVLRWAACIDIFLKANPKRTATVRYEDLLADQEQQLTILFKFARLERSSAIIANVVERTLFSRLSKGREQGDEDPLSHFRKGVKGDWRNYLPSQTAEQIVKATKPLMRNFRYVDDLSL